MKAAVRFLLVLSLAANLWLLAGRALTGRAIPPESTERRPVGLAQPKPWVAGLDTAEPAALRDRLRAAGMEEETIRAVINGLLRQRAADQLAMRRTERARTAWWRSGRLADADDAKLLQTMVAEPLAQLFDRSSFDRADAENRYLFLPADKRRLLAQIDLDYADMLARMPRVTLGPQLQSAISRQQLLEVERRKDVLAALTPDERAEYDLRFSGTAGEVVTRMGAIDGTEAEYRAIKPIMDEFAEKSQAMGTKNPGFLDAYADLQRTTMEQLVAQIGYDRALAYASSGSEQSAVRRVVRASGLPADTAGRVMLLAADTGERASDIHYDRSLTPEQKRAALVALQRSAQAQVDLVLPPEAQRQLSGDGLAWLKALEQGSYQLARPSFLSSAGYATLSVASPPPPKRISSPFFPPRPAGP
jgi:hypothetical protein